MSTTGASCEADAPTARSCCASASSGRWRKANCRSRPTSARWPRSMSASSRACRSRRRTGRRARRCWPRPTAPSRPGTAWSPRTTTRERRRNSAHDRPASCARGEYGIADRSLCSAHGIRAWLWA